MPFVKIQEIYHHYHL